MHQVDRDTTIEVSVYFIDSYETGPYPYEKHYYHKKIKVHWGRQYVQLVKGDYLVPTAQPAKRYITEVLEPTGTDAFLAWGYFDGILQQKEYFSDYVFEDRAAEMLRKDKHLKALLEAAKKKYPQLANSTAAQLNFIYEHSPYHEPEYKRYPVYRIEY